MEGTVTIIENWNEIVSMIYTFRASSILLLKLTQFEKISFVNVN